MEKISSEQNQRIKRAVRLHTSRGRQQQDRIIVFGESELLRALECNVGFEELFFCPSLASDATTQLVEQLSGQVPTFETTANAFKKICYGDRSDGLVGVAETPKRSLNGIQFKSKTPFVMILESIEKPGNVGAVFRTADAMGADAVVLSDPKTSLFHPNSIRSSLGTVFSVSCAEASNEDVVQWLSDCELTVFPTLVDATCDYWSCNFNRPSAVVLGNEANGLSKIWRDIVATPIRIPMGGSADSLNVSVAAAVVAFESARQKATGVSTIR